MKKVLIYLHNYLIMHDIKYYFLNKNNQTIQRGNFFFQGDKLSKVLSKNTIFQNPREQLPLPSGTMYIRPCTQTQINRLANQK
jgi:hypothetical protein